MGISQSTYIGIATNKNSHGSILTGSGEFIETYADFIEVPEQITVTSGTHSGGATGYHVGINADADPVDNYGVGNRVSLGGSFEVSTIRIFGTTVRVYVKGPGNKFAGGLDTIKLTVGSDTIILNKVANKAYEGEDVPGTLPFTAALADGVVSTFILRDNLI